MRTSLAHGFDQFNHHVYHPWGAGTRLWPLSRKSFPKQFVPLIGNKSLLQLTLERVAHINESNSASTHVICLASEEHRFLVSEAMQAAQVSGRIVLEPTGRNTAPAMALAAILAEPDALLLFCPSDHHIPDVETFGVMVRQGVAAALRGHIVTFGVVPSFPATAYGYIQQGEHNGDGSAKVTSFIEKPDYEKAQALILQGDTLWHAGIFFSACQCPNCRTRAVCARHLGRLSARHGLLR